MCRNPETGAPWSLTTIGEDARAIKEGWKAGVSREVEDRIAQVDARAHLGEMRRLAYAANDRVGRRQVGDLGVDFALGHAAQLVLRHELPARTSIDLPPG